MGKVWVGGISLFNLISVLLLNIFFLTTVYIVYNKFSKILMLQCVIKYVSNHKLSERVPEKKMYFINDNYINQSYQYYQNMLIDF